jgi:serine/threonine-protein kinase RsbW
LTTADAGIRLAQLRDIPVTAIRQGSASFPREIDALPEVFAFVGSFFAAGGEGERGIRHTVEFVLEEIFTNCVKYNAAGRSGIDISLQQTPEELTVRLVDSDSQPFDIRSDAPEVDPEAPIEARTPGRLGVYLVKKLMDRVEYDHTNGVSTITMFKALR